MSHLARHIDRAAEEVRQHPAYHGNRQGFYVDVENVDTGEAWGVTVTAADPESALNKVLRRRRFAEFLLSEQAFRFVVHHGISAS